MAETETVEITNNTASTIRYTVSWDDGSGTRKVETFDLGRGGGGSNVKKITGVVKGSFKIEKTENAPAIFSSFVPPSSGVATRAGFALEPS